MAYLKSLNQGNEIMMRNTQAEQIVLLEQYYSSRNPSPEVKSFIQQLKVQYVRAVTTLNMTSSDSDSEDPANESR